MRQHQPENSLLSGKMLHDIINTLRSGDSGLLDFFDRILVTVSSKNCEIILVQTACDLSAHATQSENGNLWFHVISIQFY